MQSTCRRPGRPLGTIRSTPMERLRFRLKPETAAVIERCAIASGLDVGPWLDFTIANIESGGELLAQRKERDLQIRETRQFMNGLFVLMECRSPEEFTKRCQRILRKPVRS